MIKCAKCKNVIEKDDFNVATDLAYCRRCDLNHSYRTLVEAEEFRQIALDAPPRHVRIKTDWRGGESVVYRKISPLLYFFLIPFTAFWSGTTMTTMVRAVMQEKWGEATFFLPFLLGTVVLIAVIIFFLFVRTEMHIRDDELEVFCGIPGIGFRQKALLADIKSVYIGDSNARRNKKILPEIKIRLKKAHILCFGVLMSEDAQSFFVAYLAKHLK